MLLDITKNAAFDSFRRRRYVFQMKDLVVFIREVGTVRRDPLVAAEKLGVGTNLLCVLGLDMAVQEADVAGLVMGDTGTAHPVALYPLAVGVGLDADFGRRRVEIVLVNVGQLGACFGTDGSRRVVVVCETVGLAVAASGGDWAEERLVVADIRGDVGVGVAPFRGDDVIVVVVFEGVQAVVGLREGVVVVVAVHFPTSHVLLDVGRAGDGAGLVTGLCKGGQQHGGQNRDDRDDDQQFDERELQMFLHDFVSSFVVTMFLFVEKR